MVCQLWVGNLEDKFHEELLRKLVVNYLTDAYEKYAASALSAAWSKSVAVGIFIEVYVIAFCRSVLLTSPSQ